MTWIIRPEDVRGHPHDGPPLYRLIYDRIVAGVLDGRLPPGTRLPSTRALADQLSIARGTVAAAYDLLEGEGYIVARGGAGTQIDPRLDRSLPAAQAKRARKSGGEGEAATSSEHTLLFRNGLPALDAFPLKTWSALLARRSRSISPGDLAYPDPAGFLPLRHEIARYLAVARGVTCTPDQIFVTSGYQGALALVARALIQPGDRVAMEHPGYPSARDALRLSGAQLIGVPVDRAGLDAALIPGRMRLVLVTPTQQFPLGMTMELSRRLALLEWAEANDAWIVEDDYDSEFRYVGRAVASLKSIDRQGRVLFAGTFSKVLSPGIRIAYLVVPTPLLPRLRDVASLLQMPPAALAQAAIAELMQRGHFARHIRRMRGLYAARLKALTRALEAEPELGFESHLQRGGIHLILRLPEGTDDLGLVAFLRARGIAPTPLSGTGIERPFDPGLLLGFTNVPPDKAPAAARRLAEAIADFRAGK